MRHLYLPGKFVDPTEVELSPSWCVHCQPDKSCNSGALRILSICIASSAKRTSIYNTKQKLGASNSACRAAVGAAISHFDTAAGVDVSATKGWPAVQTGGIHPDPRGKRENSVCHEIFGTRGARSCGNEGNEW